MTSCCTPKSKKFAHFCQAAIVLPKSVGLLNSEEIIIETKKSLVTTIVRHKFVYMLMTMLLESCRRKANLQQITSPVSQSYCMTSEDYGMQIKMSYGPCLWCFRAFLKLKNLPKSLFIVTAWIRATGTILHIFFPHKKKIIQV